jgi:hypothetical protein
MSHFLTTLLSTTSDTCCSLHSVYVAAPKSHPDISTRTHMFPFVTSHTIPYQPDEPMNADRWIMTSYSCRNSSFWLFCITVCSSFAIMHKIFDYRFRIDIHDFAVLYLCIPELSFLSRLILIPRLISAPDTHKGYHYISSCGTFKM